jgi:FSR family fosmidomycin resistance protein-like MFS transporter
MRYRTACLLSISHIINDIYGTSLVAAILPPLIASFNLSFAQAALLVVLPTLAQVVGGPVLGYVGDRLARRWLIALSLALNALCMGGMGLAWDFGLILLLGVLARLGSAAFHPYASKAIVAHYGEAERARAMSIFGSGGAVGRAVSPALAGALVSTLALRGVALTALPGIAMSLALLLWAPPISGGQPARTAPSHPMKTSSSLPEGGRRPSLAATLILTSLLVFIWSVVESGMMAFIPTYLVHEGRSLLMATSYASLMLLSGIVGQLMGGVLADRYGRRLVVVASMAASTPLAHLFLHADDPASLMAIASFGVALYLPYAVFPLLAAEYAPRHAGLASGLTWGLIAGGGGLLAGAFGLLADKCGLLATLSVMASLPLAVALIALILPKR